MFGESKKGVSVAREKGYEAGTVFGCHIDDYYSGNPSAGIGGGRKHSISGCLGWMGS
jgi:hypothetical protein